MQSIQKLFLRILLHALLLLGYPLYFNPIYSNNIESIIELDKLSYIEGENIVLKLYLVNASVEDIIIKNFYSDILSQNFILTNSQNKSFNYGGITSTRLGVTQHTFKANEIKNYRFFLLEDRGILINEPLIPVGTLPYYLPEDTYTIKFNGYDGKIPESNLLTFKVEKPTGHNDSAYKKWQKIAMMDVYEGKHIEKIIKIRDFIHQYPESAYLDQAFMNLIFFDSAPNLPADMLEDCIWFINTNPNSVIIDVAINSLINNVRKKYGDDEIKMYLENIISSYPYTNAMSLADKIIKENYK